MPSHPSGVRELKPPIEEVEEPPAMSHPSGVRELKHFNICITIHIQSRTLQGCVN